MNIYLDNAATTAIDHEVFETMLPYLKSLYGNPSSLHAQGRQAKEAVEQARQSVAILLNVSPWEIIFTSGATEANNLALSGTIQAGNIRHVISSRIEHPSVLNCLKQHAKVGTIRLNYVKLNEKGHPELNHLEHLLRENSRSLISLMHANNEVGNLNNLRQISNLAQRYDAIFHSDTVQTIGAYAYDLKALPLDFLVGSAHKFHGPKGIGFLYINKRMKPNVLLYGGSQERNLRAGTENVSGIVGLAKALEITRRDHQETHAKIKSLKCSLIDGLQELFPAVAFNGDSASADCSLYSTVNVSLPKAEKDDSLLAWLDAHGIAASGGSACSSHGNSHVLKELSVNGTRENIRFSFSKFNTEADVKCLLEKLGQYYAIYQTSLPSYVFAE